MENVTVTSYSYPSFFEILFVATADFFKRSLPFVDSVVLVVLLVFTVVVLIQFVASLQKRYKIIRFTAFVLLAFSFLFLILMWYLVLVAGISIYFGYYLFLILQILLVLFSDMPNTQAEATTPIGNIYK